jgi:hypothetical protein
MDASPFASFAAAYSSMGDLVCDSVMVTSQKFAD